MRLPDLLKLSHREFTAYRTRSHATVVTIGLLFGLLLAVLFVAQGLENVALRYAASSTPAASSYDVADSPTERVQKFFRTQNRDFVRPASIVLLVAAVFILAFTLSHLLVGNAKTFALYRSLGATKLQLLLIYFFYLLELCLRAAIFALIFAVVLAGLATATSWDYLLDQFSAAYPGSPQFSLILIGWNSRCLEVIGCLFLSAPLSFLLCLDQFSAKKLAQRLKGD